MGEAKRKAALSAGLVLSPDQQADVARLVRAIAFDVGRGGACLFRAVVGQAALAALGHPSTIVFGGMLYRAGPDELVDTVAFCGPGNAALLMARQMLGHYWLQAGRDLIDFTVGD